VDGIAPIDSSFLKSVVFSNCAFGSSLHTPCTMVGKFSSCRTKATIGIGCHVTIHSQISCRACTFCAAAPPPPRVESSIAALSWPVANIIRFFCRFSSRFVFLSSTMLSSLLRRASSASMPFLKPFFRASARLVGRSMFEWAALGLPTLTLCDVALAILQPTLDLFATVPEDILP